MLEKLLKPVFQRFEVPEEQHAILLYKFALLEVSGGSYLFHEGDAPEYFYIVLTGKVSIEKTRYGEKDFLRSLRAGSYFGEATFLYVLFIVTSKTVLKLLLQDQAGRFASIVADEFSQLAVLDGRYVQSYLLPYFRRFVVHLGTLKSFSFQ